MSEHNKKFNEFVKGFCTIDEYGEYHLDEDSVIDLLNAMRKWISVKDRLPCEQEYVLIFDGTYQIDRLIDDNDYPGLSWEYNFDNHNITHWMPLPEEPTE